MYNKNSKLALIKIFSLFIIEFLLLSNAVWSVPANSNWITVFQPDSNKINIKINGDERMHWYENKEGHTLLLDSTGYFVYAIKDSLDNLIPSTYRYYSADTKLKSSLTNSIFVKNLPKKLFFSSEQVQKFQKECTAADKFSNKPIDKPQQYNTHKIEGTRKYLVILMSYPDKPFTRTREEFEALFNTTGYKTNSNEGSVKDYFVQNSYGKFTPEFVVVGPYEAKHPMAYYKYNSNIAGTTQVRELIEEAISAANNDVNYVDFDNDNDEYVDAVTVVYSGFSADRGVPNTIWPHASILANHTTRYDGKYVSRYCCSSELVLNYSGTTMAKIGTFCHEFCHTIGSPDYYDVDYQEQGYYEGGGSWCLMSAGNHNGNGGCPSSINSFQKWMFGWIEPVVLSTKDKSVLNMPPTANTPIAYRINTEIEDEFFILENRQKVGFDKYLDGHGLLIWHVHSQLATKLNNNERGINATHPQLLYPVCASSNISIPNDDDGYGNINSSGCVFPGTSNKTSFTNSSVPTAISWNKNMVTPITNIREIDTFVSFDYNIYTVPYTYNFTAANHYQYYQIINPTLPDISWQRIQASNNWMTELRSIYSSDQTQHYHYLFLPPLYLETGSIYHFKFNSRVYSSNYPGNAKVFLCRSNNIDDAKQLLFDFSDISSTSFQTKAQDFSVNENGVYYIAISSYTQGDIMDLYIDDIDISKTVDIYDDAPDKLSINCYPNPADNRIFINNLSNELIEKIDVVDITGKISISQEYINSALYETNNNSISIDISNLLTGNYYLLIHTSTGNKKIKKFIKK